jgi:uncharacterized protein YcbK (DUF882 family)
MKYSELKQLIKEEIASILNESEKFDVDKWKEDWEKEKAERQKKKLKDEKPLTPDEVKKMQRFKLDMMFGSFNSKVNRMDEMDFDELSALYDHPLFSKNFSSKTKKELEDYLETAINKLTPEQLKKRGIK